MYCTRGLALYPSEMYLTRKLENASIDLTVGVFEQIAILGYVVWRFTPYQFGHWTVKSVLFY